MRLIEILHPGTYPWFIQILERYHLDVFCIPQQPDCQYFYDAADGKRLFKIGEPCPDSAILYRSLVLNGVTDPGIQIIIQCKISKMMLGFLASRTTQLKDNKGYISCLASVNAALSKLQLPSQMGSKIGSLLLTSYSLFLLSKTKISRFCLSATQASSEFYSTKIKMQLIDHDGHYFLAKNLPCPGEEYYQNLMSPIDIPLTIAKNFSTPADLHLATTFALALQRRYRGKKIFKVCHRLKTLVELLKQLKEHADTTVERAALQSILTQLSDQVSFKEDITDSVDAGNLLVAIRKYLNMPFMEIYKDIPLVHELRIKFGLIKTAAEEEPNLWVV